MTEPELRERILGLVGEYARAFSAPPPFEPGKTPIPASGKLIGEAEIRNLVEASLDGWLTAGRFNEAFEAKLAQFLGLPFALTANSGSSANLLAVSALTSPSLGRRALKAGDEVITVAAGFPTTVNPLLLYGLVPVFVDVRIPTYNVDPGLVEGAISPRTRAIVLAHTLGNPFDLGEILRLVRKHDLWLIEDCCDALGATYGGRPVGTFGHLATASFYPAHQITMGEGGAVFTADPELKRLVESFRDWGRDCYCAPGKENTCGKRFGWKLGELPAGYDHKYIYSNLGFNLKITDMQAACGLAQLARLPEFVERRRRNFVFLRERLRSVEEFLVLPEATAASAPSWFGFPLTIRETSEVRRADLQRFLGQYGVGTRLLFGGNLTRQPYFAGRHCRIAGELRNTDAIMERTFWIGIHPALTDAMLEYAASRLELFFGVGV